MLQSTWASHLVTFLWVLVFITIIESLSCAAWLTQSVFVFQGQWTRDFYGFIHLSKNYLYYYIATETVKAYRTILDSVYLMSVNWLFPYWESREWTSHWTNKIYIGYCTPIYFFCCWCRIANECECEYRMDIISLKCICIICLKIAHAWFPTAILLMARLSSFVLCVSRVNRLSDCFLTAGSDNNDGVLPPPINAVFLTFPQGELIW